MFKILLYLIFSFYLLACSNNTLNNTNYSRVVADNSKKEIQIEQYIGNGAPEHMGRELPKEAYVKFKAKRLKNAKVIWINFELLRELGIKFPKEGMTAEFEERLLDLFAYMVPQASDSPDDFIEKFVTLYADRYGGLGIVDNGGSGRGAVHGPVSVKNIGQTPLVGKMIPFDHRHGGGSIKEAFQEASWGEIANQDLKYGANRVLFILDTGTFTVWPDGSRERRSIIVRENPLRPAHYIVAKLFNPDQVDENLVSEPKRMKQVLKKILDGLPKNYSLADESQMPVNQVLQRRLDDLLERLAEQIGMAFAKKIFHGAIASSNIEVSGRYLDYASVTSLPGYVKMKGNSPNFPVSTEEYRWLENLYLELYQTLEKYWPSFRKEDFIAPNMMNMKLANKYNYFRSKELIKMMGFPSQIVENLVESENYKQLTVVINKLIFIQSQKIYNAKDDLTKIETLTDFEKLVPFLIENRKKNSKKVFSKLPVSGMKLDDWQLLYKYFHGYLSEVIDAAKLEGVIEKNLLLLIYKKSKLLNRNRPDLYRENFKKNIVSLVDQYQNSGDRSHLWDRIDQIVSSNQRTYNHVDKFQVVVKYESDVFNGTSITVVFDAKIGKNKLIIKGPINESEASFFHHKIPLNEFLGSKLRVTENNWDSFQEQSIEIEKNTFRIEKVLDDDTEKLEFVLRSSNQSKWWKSRINDQNFQLIFNRLMTDDCYKLIQDVF